MSEKVQNNNLKTKQLTNDVRQNTDVNQVRGNNEGGGGSAGLGGGSDEKSRIRRGHDQADNEDTTNAKSTFRSDRS